MSREVPTASIRSPRTAIASAPGLSGSTVATRPLVRMRSAGSTLGPHATHANPSETTMAPAMQEPAGQRMMPLLLAGLRPAMAGIVQEFGNFAIL